MAPLQKRALYSLLIGLVLTAAFVIVLFLQGDITSFDNNVNVRMVLYAALIGVPLVYLVLVQLTLKKPTQVDERDRRIMEKSHKIQWMATIISLAAWSIILTEVFWDRGEVPVVYLNLIFVSILIISSLAQSFGIVIGYRSKT